ncbi:unnamed protein product, partial [marine sediment metagenome]
AAMISKRKDVGFKGIFINDINSNERKVLNERLKALNEATSNKYKLYIDISDEKIDSNEWVIDIIANLSKHNKIFNYLMIIDNQGMDIEYKTIKNRSIYDFLPKIVKYSSI